MSDLPESVRAIVVREFGGPEVLALAQIPLPAIGPDELLVEVHVAGVNPVDVTNHEDREWAGLELPYTPGSDVSGVVRGRGCGHALRGRRRGRRTDGLPRCATRLLRRVPTCARGDCCAQARLALARRGCVGARCCGHAFEVVVRRLDVQRDERVVIFGAAGGVGGFATPLAILRGAQVIAVGRASSHEYLRSLGAALVIDHSFDDAVAQIADAIGEIDRNLTLHGVLVRPDGARLEELASMLERGELRPTIRGVRPLELAADAHREVAAGGVPGKTVISVR